MDKRPTATVFSIRLLPEERAALERAAKADERPPATMARKIITDWLKRRQEKRT
jgi:predicted transcriptional regulator